MDSRQYEATLADAEIRLKRLRTLYDQWFMGLERLEPQKQKTEVERIIADLKLKQPRNTALRFRLNQLVQRYTTYSTYWTRISRQIEEGTYKRDVLRARRRYGMQSKPSESKKRDAYELDLEIDVDAALEALKSEPPSAAAARGDSSAPGARESERPSRAPREITPFALPTPPPPRPNSGPLRAPPPPASAVQASLRPRAAPPPVPPGASRNPPPPGVPRKPPAQGAASLPAAARPGAVGSGASMSDEQLLSLYQRYVSARRDNKERTDNVRIEAVAKTVRDMMPKLKEKHAGKQIDFEVVVKNGRVALKPVPK